MKRLDKILSDAGVAGRRELKDMIRAGRVSVDGVVVDEYADDLEALRNEYDDDYEEDDEEDIDESINQLASDDDYTGNI